MTQANADEQDRLAMAQLTAGKESALDEIMGRHAERLYHYLLRVLQNETEASEVAEEAFVRVFQHRHRYKSQNKFSTWLYAIATNLARDVQRYHARHPQVPLDAELRESGQSFREILPDPKASPIQSLETAERTEAV